MPKRVFAIAVFLFVSVNATTAEQRVDKNVVYGMYSGLALLMDVYHPEKPNGYGVIVIPGSGWQAELRYGAPALKDTLEAAGVKTQFVRVPEGSHVWTKDWAGFPGMIVEWLDQHLKRSAPSGK